MIISGDLPPVGHRISLRSQHENPLQHFFKMYQYWVDSGTSALALALLDAKARCAHVRNPRAIIPGYCCPDLVAACVYAGVEPVAVDICHNDPAYDQEHLRAHLDERVVAVIAVSFLGISERLPELRRLISDLGLNACLIEDNAQWFPAQQDQAAFESDYVVFSFGRGKPLSLLGGGLLLAAAPLLIEVNQQIVAATQPSFLSAFLFSSMVRAYNALLSPPLYRLINRNPVIKLGQTQYHALENIQQMDAVRCSLIAENFAAYSARQSVAVDVYNNAACAKGLQQMAALNSARVRRLLRYPLVCASASARNNLLIRLVKAGLGATVMYPAAIDAIDGVNGRVCVPANLHNARDFAQRFITLPVHSGVSAQHQRQITALLLEAV